MSSVHTTTSSEETILYASAFAGRLQRGDVVALYGDLGSGKTQFVKGICLAFKACSPVTSPTFVLLNRYQGVDKNGDELLMYHFDLYRVASVNELYDLGYEEFLRNDGICFIEWAETLGTLLPEKRYDVRLSLGVEENERRIEMWEVGKQ
jgi:tRNA threonylcarbamoyladenosine biosynthesis protein TsaE